MNANRGMLEHNNLNNNIAPSGNTFPPSFPQQHPQDALFSGLDASSSKQLAAIAAAANARRAHAHAQASAAAAGGPTSANFVGGITPQLQSFPPSSNIHQSSFPSSALPLATSHNMQTNISPQTAGLAQRQQMSPQQAAVLSKNRRMHFYQGLSRVMASRNMPLPSSITGVDSPYDPTTSPWKDLQPASELGGVKLAGKDVDLYRLWGIVFGAGGAGRVQQQGAWMNILSQFDLPQQLPQPQENGNTSTGVALAQLYMKLLGAFEEFYYRGMADTQRQGQGQGLNQQGRPLLALSASAHGPGPGPGHNMSPPGSAGISGNMTAQIQNQPGLMHSDLSNNPVSAGMASPENDNDLDAEARKRKVDEAAGDNINININEEENGKRRKTDPEHSSEASRNTSEHASHSQMFAPSSSAATRVKARRKIEYVPLAREIETAGGRDVTAIQNEFQRLSRGQHLRDINDWGKVYVDSLTMSIRSRLSVELSYGLTTLIILSTMRSQGHDTGFLITQCGELLDEILDLLEELSFPVETDTDVCPASDEFISNRQLVNLAHDETSTPFASEKKKQGEYDPAVEGPMQRRGDLIRLILNIIRNLSAVTENQAFMARHPVLIDLLLRLTSIRITEGEPPAALSEALALPDLIAVRKEVLNVLVNLGGSVTLSARPSQSQPSASPVKYDRRARLIFDLISSYLIDPIEAVSPFAWVVQSGVPMSPSVRAPLLVDAALEVFTRTSQPDANRKVISRSVPERHLWNLFESLVHRLPSTDNDFKLVARDESWMSYLEKTVLSLYSLAFLMPPDLKRRVKGDRSLCFAKVMLRFVKRIMSGGPGQADFRMQFVYCARRSVETMKVIDDGEDSFNVEQPSVPTLSFGVGYGEAGDTRVERGDGLLGGHEDEILWSVMLQREVDDVMFAELESLARVEREVRVY